MNPEPSTGNHALSSALLRELIEGGPGLPPARERWAALLTHRSPRVRLDAEVALLQAQCRNPRLEPASDPPAPRHVPPFGVTEPKRHCSVCFGHEFWIDGQRRLHCDHCEPMPTV
jgi:hypothetical protein